MNPYHDQKIKLMMAQLRHLADYMADVDKDPHTAVYIGATVQLVRSRGLPPDKGIPIVDKVIDVLENEGIIGSGIEA